METLSLTSNNSLSLYYNVSIIYLSCGVDISLSKALSKL